MTDQAPDQKRPETTEEAAEIVKNDPALNKATERTEEDAATDDDARTPDQAQTGRVG